MTISQRRDRLRQRLADAELDAMLVSDLVNVRYNSKAVSLQADGKIVIGGQFSGLGIQPVPHLARMNADGTVNVETAKSLGWDRGWEKRSGRPALSTGQSR